MPILKICPRCKKLIKAGTVCQCYKKEISTRNKEYDKLLRDKERDAFYHSSSWKNISKYILSNFNYIDLYVYYMEKRIVEADRVHHIKPLKECWDLRLNSTNLIPLSEKSHQIIHSLYRQGEYTKAHTQALLYEAINLANMDFKQR